MCLYLTNWLKQNKAFILVYLFRDCAIITWRGGWKIRGGIGENDNKRGGVDVKFSAYRGHYFFIPFCKLEKQ